jgi:hypothetical protein
LVAAQIEFDKQLCIANTLHGFETGIVERLHTFKIEINGIGIEFQMHQLFKCTNSGKEKILVGKDPTDWLLPKTMDETDPFLSQSTPYHSQMSCSVIHY